MQAIPCFWVPCVLSSSLCSEWLRTAESGKLGAVGAMLRAQRKSGRGLCFWLDLVVHVRDLEFVRRCDGGLDPGVTFNVRDPEY
jgi:hypothetical protein